MPSRTQLRRAAAIPTDVALLEHLAVNAKPGASINFPIHT